MPDLVLIRNEYHTAAALHRVLDYVTRSGMTGGYAAAPETAFAEFQMVRYAYHKEDNASYLFHFVVSFTTAESYRLSVDDMLALGFEICQFFPDHQTVYALHLDAQHPHLHFVVNRVSFENGHLYADGQKPFWRIRDFLRQRFPRSDPRIYQSFSDSDVNCYGCSDDDELLRLD